MDFIAGFLVGVLVMLASVLFVVWFLFEAHKKPTGRAA